MQPGRFRSGQKPAVQEWTSVAENSVNVNICIHLSVTPHFPVNKSSIRHVRDVGVERPSASRGEGLAFLGQLRMKFCIGAFISAVWLLAAPLASAETVKVGVLPNVYAQSLEALIPEAKAQGLDIQSLSSPIGQPRTSRSSPALSTSITSNIDRSSTTPQSREVTTLASPASAYSATLGSIR
jgi:hypothetical protein